MPRSSGSSGWTISCSASSSALTRRPSSISRGSSARLDALLDAGVEGAAEAHVRRVRRTRARCGSEPSGRRRPRPAPRSRAARTGRRRRRASPARAPRQAAALERPRDERDRAVAARGRVALVVEEDDAEVGAVVLGLGDEAAVHVGVAARLVDEQLADVVEVLERETALCRGSCVPGAARRRR